jgi:hypothetical protein
VGCGGEALEEPDGPRSSLGPELLATGLLGLSAAHRYRWNHGHHGAAVIAACYLCEENGLDDRAAAALGRQVEAYIGSRRKMFQDLEPGSGDGDPARIVSQLAEHVGELRSGGHDAIYAALALRALRDLPSLATPTVVEGVCSLLRKFVETVPAIPATAYQRENPLPPYESDRDLARRTLDALLLPWGQVQAVGAGVVVHWITHADALITLAELGHEDVARRGHEAHLQYVNSEVSTTSDDEPARSAIDWRRASYWESDAPRLPQKGTWFFGHSFKLPYSLFRLVRKAEPTRVADACLARASKLSIPFE